MIEGVTDEQFNEILKAIIIIIEQSESKEEALKELEELLNN